MAIAFDTYSYNLLHRWQARMLESPWLFNQIKDYNTDSIEGVYYQRHRESIAHSLNDAVEWAAKVLGFSPFPQYHNKIAELERVEVPSVYDRPYYMRPWGFVLNVPHFIRFGEPKNSETSYEGVKLSDQDAIDATSRRLNLSELADVEADRDVAISQNRYNEITVFRVSDMPANHNRNDVMLVYTANDLPRHNLTDPQYAIPWEFYENDGSDVLYGVLKANLVKPEILMKRDSNPIDPQQSNFNDNFVSSIRIYTIENDTEDKVRLLSFNNARTDIVKTAFTPIRIGDSNKFLIPNDVLAKSYSPYGVEVYFESGYKLQDNGRINESLENAVIRLANTNRSMRALPLSITSRNIWQDDATSLIDQESKRIDDYFINPLGTSLGHYEAWNIFKHYGDEIQINHILGAGYRGF